MRQRKISTNSGSSRSIYPSRKKALILIATLLVCLSAWSIIYTSFALEDGYSAMNFLFWGHRQLQLEHGRLPNVLIIIADDLRLETSVYGQSTQAPHLQALAARGVVFDRAYAQVIMNILINIHNFKATS